MRVEVYKETTDDFYPNFILGDKGSNKKQMVRISLSLLSTKQYRVAVWGSDDFGMDKDFDNHRSAWDLFYSIVGTSNPVTIFDLK